MSCRAACDVSAGLGDGSAVTNMAESLPLEEHTGYRSPTVDELEKLVADELAVALGLSAHGWARRVLNPILRIPASRLALLAAAFEERLERYGLVASMRWLLSQYVETVEVRGAEQIPAHGPLLVAANHPGAYDALAIMANLGRDDVRIVISDVPVTRALTVASQLMIYVAPGTHGRMAATRTMLRCLRQGCALLVFPSGIVDPDPDLLPGAEKALESWSPSLDLLLRRVPETLFVASIVSGVLAPSCLRNPLTRLARVEWRRRKLAEFLQVSQQVAFSRKFGLNVRVSFGAPVTAATLTGGDTLRRLLPAITENAKALLSAHMMAAS